MFVILLYDRLNTHTNIDNGREKYIHKDGEAPHAALEEHIKSTKKTMCWGKYYCEIHGFLH